jgi:hypothetical protein
LLLIVHMVREDAAAPEAIPRHCHSRSMHHNRTQPRFHLF